jgi:hypothetical protein
VVGFHGLFFVLFALLSVKFTHFREDFTTDYTDSPDQKFLPSAFHISCSSFPSVKSVKSVVIFWLRLAALRSFVANPSFVAATRVPVPHRKAAHFWQLFSPSVSSV